MELVTGQLMSRSEAVRAMKPVLPALTAIGIASDRAAESLSRTLVPPEQRRHLQPKLLGITRTAMWTEGARLWAGTVPGVRVFAPFSWVELLVHGRIHLRIEAETDLPRSERRRRRRAQLPDEAIPPDMLACEDPLALDLVPVYSEVTGRLKYCQLIARLHTGYLWEPVMVDLAPGRRQLDSWMRRDLELVPWLKVIANAAEMSSLRSVLPVQQSAAGVETLRPAAGTVPPRPRFGTRLDQAQRPDAGGAETR